MKNKEYKSMLYSDGTTVMELSFKRLFRSIGTMFIELWCVLRVMIVMILLYFEGISPQRYTKLIKKWGSGL